MTATNRPTRAGTADPRFLILTAAFVLASLTYLALSVEAAPMERKTLADLSWLSGTWVEQKEDGSTIEVVWSAPIGDAMVGTWRIVKDGELRAYEILTMRQTDAGIYYRFDLYRKSDQFSEAGKTVFKLASLDGRRAVFDLEGASGQITIRITEEGRLTGAWWDPEKPGDPPAVGYNAAPVK